jgi:nicotinamidase-related amidase
MSTALLVMDVQQNILSRYANDATYLARLRRAIDAARRAKIRLVYVTVSFPPAIPR